MAHAIPAKLWQHSGFPLQESTDDLDQYLSQTLDLIMYQSFVHIPHFAYDRIVDENNTVNIAWPSTYLESCGNG